MTASGSSGRRVTLERISKLFGDVPAVQAVDFDIPKGEFLTLLGPSGSGKTTLLKIVAGYERPSEGRLAFDGQDMGAVPVARRNIGMVFQNYALFPHLTVARNVAFPLEMRRVPRPEIERLVAEALALVELPDLGRRMPGQLSGGQQQRVALARAIVFKPGILLMDEPLGALDKNLRQTMQVEIKKLHRRIGATVIYVTHDQEEAMHLSDRVVVLNHGRIEQAGSPEELYHRPRNVFVASFLGECNLMPGRVVGRGEATADVAVDQDARFSVRVNGSRFGPGDRVIVGVRPEKVHVGREAERCANRLAGEVEEVIFLGAGRKVITRARSGTVVADVPHRPGEDAIHRGDRIALGFSAEEALLLPLPTADGER